jgi:GNAT superfamily N-acetyltransferase
MIAELVRLERSGQARPVGFSLWALRDLQGLMVVDVGGLRHSVEDGLPQLYVEYLAVAPQNRRTLRVPRVLDGCGSVLLRAAVDESHRLGWSGRVALHALPGAVGFYLARGFRDLGPDPHAQGYRYLERCDTV